MRKKISESRNKFEDLIQMAKNSEQGMNFLYSSLSNLVEPLQKITPATRVDKHDEYESFLGNRIPTEVYIHQTISGRKGDPKELGRARSLRPEVEVRVRRSASVGNVSK